MHPDYFGDSYDLVKRFFSLELSRLGYEVFVDPKFNGDWQGRKEAFFNLIQAKPLQSSPLSPSKRALFLDPDTGVKEKGTDKHTSFLEIANLASDFGLVICFDQSFSRQSNPEEIMQEKMKALKIYGCDCMYYDSHARFLFASKQPHAIAQLIVHLRAVGLPESRLVACRA